MVKFLADENIPLSVVIWLQDLGYDVTQASQVGLKGCPDRRIIGHAQREDRIILTLDRDFASLYYEMDFGVVIIRVHPATPPRIRSVLEKVFAKVELREHVNSLTTASQSKVEIITSEP